MEETRVFYALEAYRGRIVKAHSFAPPALSLILVQRFRDCIEDLQCIWPSAMWGKSGEIRG